MKKINSLRAQVATEAMVYLAFFMLMFVAILLFVLSDFNNDIQRRQFALTKGTADQIGDYAQFVLSTGPGFEGNFSVPKDLSGRPYSIRFQSSGWIYLDTTDSEGIYQTFPYAIGFSNFRCCTGKKCESLYCNDHTSGAIKYSQVLPDKGWLYIHYLPRASATEPPIIEVN